MVITLQKDALLIPTFGLFSWITTSEFFILSQFPQNELPWAVNLKIHKVSVII